MAIKKFYQGSATFKCNVCGRGTRDTGSNGSCNLCPQCFELAGMENEVSDGYRTNAEAASLAIPFVAEIEAKGGDASSWYETFNLSFHLKAVR